MNRCYLRLLGVAIAVQTVSGPVFGQIAPGVQEGDLFVGARSTTSDARGIFRVRDGIVTPFALGSTDGNDSGFFDVPHDVIVDSHGRVVWLAPLAAAGPKHVGLFRASGEGATPERLAIFRTGDHDLDAGYPVPFPNDRLASYENGPPTFGLHLASNRRIEIDDRVDGGRPHVITEDAYVMGLISGTGGIATFSDAKTVSYGATTGAWDDSLPDPIYSRPPETANHFPPVDLVSHAGAIYSINGDGLRRSSTPLRVDATGSIDLGSLGDIDFSLGLRLFGGDHDVRGITVDDTKIPNIPCNCAENLPDPPHHLMPWDGGFIPMSGFRSLTYDPQLGLVISSSYGPLAPYLTHISETLLNDIPGDDLDAYYYQPYAGDAPTPSLGVTRMFAPGQFVDPGTGIWYPADASVTGAPGGGALLAASTLTGSIHRVSENGDIDVLATGLNYPLAVGAYPTYSSPATGLSVIIRIDSPVDALLTAPDGRQIGIDPLTGFPVNDFGENGFDSGPGEPRYFAIQNAALGGWDVNLLGTGDGPFAVTVYGIDLEQPIGTLARMTGTAFVGSERAVRLVVEAGGIVTLVPEPSTMVLFMLGVPLVLLRLRWPEFVRIEPMIVAASRLLRCTAVAATVWFWFPAMSRGGPVLLEVGAHSGVNLGSTGGSDDDQRSDAFPVSEVHPVLRTV